MRVVAGSLGGRNFDSPKSPKTHPMGDKIRGALFNTLGDMSGLSVFDPFSGSGAVAIESVSRGAREVVALDMDKLAVATIMANLKSLGIADQIEVRLTNAAGWVRRNSRRQFDVVVADPPYDNIDRTVLAKVALACKPGGLVVLSLPPTGNLKMLPDNFEPLSSKTYGDATLSFYRRIN